MMEDVLKVINDGMQAMGLDYEYMEWTKKPVYPYWVGEYSEFESTTEDGLQTGTVVLTGFTRGKWTDMEQAKSKIECYFDTIVGKTVVADTGSVVAVFYGKSFPIRTDDATLKKLQINLTFMKWKVK